MSDPRQPFGDDGDFGIGAFGGGRADSLVRTPLAGVAFAGFLGLRTRTVLCYLLAGAIGHSVISSHTGLRSNEVRGHLGRRSQICCSLLIQRGCHGLSG